MADTNRSEQLECVIPDTDIWKQELAPFLEVAPNPSLALTNGLGGAYFLTPSSTDSPSPTIRRDRDGCSIPGRMAIYSSRLLLADFELDSLPLQKRVETVILLGLTAELVTDQLTVMSEDSIWRSLSSEAALSDAENLISSARRFLLGISEDAAGWRDGAGTAKSQLVNAIIRTLIDEARHLTSKGLYYARVLSNLLQALVESHGLPSSGEQWLENLDFLKTSTVSVLPAVAVLSGLGESASTSKIVNKFCNRLISDIAGANVGQEKTLTSLVLLNTCTQIYDIGELPVAGNRLVFAVRQLTSWLETPSDLDYRFAAEVCRCLQRLLPCIKDVYGSYWESAVEFCIYIWTESMTKSLDHRLPAICSSLRLIATLQSIEDPNDDLVDVLESSMEKRSTALIELLKVPREHNTQPLEIVDSIISRHLEKVPLEHIRDLSELYGLVASESRAIQIAAFTMLHKALPAVQEKLSLDILLEKRDAQLPDELLSLLLDAPTLETYPDEVLTHFPAPIRSYLLSWHLVFDSFRSATFRVRSDYTENIKAANYIGPLMEFTFDVLGHSAAHPLNLDKANFTAEQIREYDVKLAGAETEERDMQWLLIHLYYLVLKYVPGLFKAWYIECRSKQTKIAVASWMTKHFSPIIISEALNDVLEWSTTQEAPGEDEKELVVRVSHAAKEVTAGYEVDEQEALIAIRVPPNYPLEGVSVTSVNRVVVNEKKWQSWIMTTQGVITFSVCFIVCMLYIPRDLCLTYNTVEREHHRRPSDFPSQHRGRHEGTD